MDIESKLFVQSITISVTMSGDDHGSRDNEFISLRGQYPSLNVPIEELHTKVVGDSLDMFLSAWESLISTQYVKGSINSDELKQQLEIAKKKTHRVIDYVKKVNSDNSGPNNGVQG